MDSMIAVKFVCYFLVFDHKLFVLAYHGMYNATHQRCHKDYLWQKWLYGVVVKYHPLLLMGRPYCLQMQLIWLVGPMR